MSRKRRNTSSPESDYSPPAKKSRSSVSLDDEGDTDSDDPEDVQEQPRFNPDVGLPNAFPGLQAGGDELFYGPAADGIEYLRMVRSEAKSVPSLLVAPTTLPFEQHIDNEGEDEYEDEEGGFYFDGTYMGTSKASEGVLALPAAQQQYYIALLERFYLLRRDLLCIPSATAISALGESRPITLPPKSRIARDAWERHMLHCEPHPVQVASIDVESVLELLKLFIKRLDKCLDSSSGRTIRRVGCWVWALLARCPERGELGGDEIAELRALATRAVECLHGNDSARAVAVEDTEESGDDDDELGATVREALMARVEMQSVDIGLDQESALGQTSMSRGMILDTIITIVGEVYGQRDLLQQRKIWTEQEQVIMNGNGHELVEV